jgi:predicted PurR-regulated permease PerM
MHVRMSPPPTTMYVSSDRSRAFWVAVALALVGVLGFVLYAFVGTFVLGLFLYYASRPIYRRLRQRIHPPTLAAAVALFALVLPVLILFWYTAAVGLGELQSLAELDTTAYEDLLGPYTGVVGPVEEFRAVVQSALDDPRRLLAESGVRDSVRDVAAATTAYLGSVLTGLLHLFVAVAIAFYLLRDGDRLRSWILTHFPDDTLVAYGEAVDADLGTVFFGNILNALLIGIVGALVFSALAAVAPPSVPVPVPILLGLLAGAGSLLPVIGMKIVYLPVTLYLVALSVLSDPQSIWFPIVFFLVTFALVDTIPDLVVRPYVSGRNLHVGAVMFAYIFGPLLFGWYGIFLGPMLLVLVVQFVRLVLPELVAGVPIRPLAVDPSYLVGPSADPEAGPSADSEAGSAVAADADPPPDAGDG